MSPSFNRDPLGLKEYSALALDHLINHIYGRRGPAVLCLPGCVVRHSLVPSVLIDVYK